MALTTRLPYPPAYLVEPRSIRSVNVETASERPPSFDRFGLAVDGSGYAPSQTTESR